MNPPRATGRFAIINRITITTLIIAIAAIAIAAAPVADGTQSPPRWIAVVMAVVDLGVVCALFARGHEVRLLLLLGAFPLFAVQGRLPEMVGKIASEMANGGTVVPICSAMGFAYVLRLTECDQHLVRLLLRPLRRMRVLLVPGGIAAGYLINTTIVSQSATAAVLGPILIPLLRAGGLGRIAAGSVLLLGSSMGGELFNPGSVEMRKLAELTHLTAAEVVARSTRLNLLACSVALVTFWILATRRRVRTVEENAAATTSPDTDLERLSLTKAFVPVLPIVLLTLDAAMGNFPHTEAIGGPGRILAAMMIGVVAAGLTSPATAPRLVSRFFDGAGYGYTHVISLIVVASTFAEGIRQSGLIEILIGALVPRPNAAMMVATAAPWSLAFVAGTGIAPAIAIMEFFVPVAGRMGIDPVRLGTLAALGAHFGRTMSPASAVAAMSASLAESRPSELVRHVAVPLLIGGVVLMAAVLLRLI
jgi:DcuC family C4-dicarboxylate transporter